MFGFGFTELLIILLVVLFFAGGRKLPQMGENLGRAVTGFKKALQSQEKPGEVVKKNEG